MELALQQRQLEQRRVANAAALHHFNRRQSSPRRNRRRFHTVTFRGIIYSSVVFNHFRAFSSRHEGSQRTGTRLCLRKLITASLPR